MNSHINKNMKIVEDVMVRLRKAREEVGRLEREAAEQIVTAAMEISGVQGPVAQVAATAKVTTPPKTGSALVHDTVKVRSHYRSLPSDPSIKIEVKSHGRGHFVKKVSDVEQAPQQIVSDTPINKKKLGRPVGSYGAARKEKEQLALLAKKKPYEKCCPQCETTFRTARKDVTTCSRRCSTIYFQKGDYLPKIAAKNK